MAAMTLRARLAAALPELKQRGFYRHHAEEADKAYRAIVAENPAAAPDKATLARIEQYAGDVLGSRAHGPWLRTYTAFRGRFVEGWMPDSYFGGVVLPAIQGSRTRRVSGSKTLARRTLMSDLVPDLATHVRGCWLDRDGNPVAPGDVAALLFDEADTVFVKLDRSGQGRDIHRLRRDGFDVAKVAALGDFVVQRGIDQHPALAAVNAGSVGPLRITTVKPRGGPAQARGAFIVFGRAGHASTRPGEAVRTGIVDAEGSVLPFAVHPDWRRCAAHPDSGVAFAGFRVPGFAAASAAVTALHDRVPHLAVIGWDIAIDRDARPQVMELNAGHVGIRTNEAMTGPWFAGLGWEQLWKKEAVELGW